MRGFEGGQVEPDVCGLHGFHRDIGSVRCGLPFWNLAGRFAVRTSRFSVCWRGGGTPFVAAGHVGTLARLVSTG